MGIVLTHNAKYKPMSFERLIQPYVMATEEYRTLEKGIADLDAEAENLRSIAEKDIVRNDDGSIDRKQSKGYAIKYMDYANSLDKQAEQLASRGLKGVNRKSLYDLQAQYKTNVKPIETAVESKKKLSEEQRKLAAANPDLRFDKDFSTLDLQQLIDNPDLGYTSYNLEDFGKRGTLSGTGILGKMSEVTSLDPSGQWYNITKGVSQEDYATWLSGDTNPANYSDPQALSALNEAKKAAEEIASTVPEHLRQEVFDRTFESAVNAMGQTTKEKANTDYIDKSTKISLRSKGFDETGNIDKNNPYWVTQGIKFNDDGTIEFTKPSSANTVKRTHIGKGRIMVQYPDGTVSYEQDPGYPQEKSDSKSDSGRVPLLSEPIVYNTKNGKTSIYNGTVKGIVVQAEELFEEDKKALEKQLSSQDNLDNYTIYKKGRNYILVPRDIKLVDTTDYSDIINNMIMSAQEDKEE